MLAMFALLIADGCGETPFTPAAASRELAVGDRLPDIELVNQSGGKIHLSDFRGKALAVTFIYSRCPSPELCPMVSRSFDTVQSLLARLGTGETCQLLSISLDAANDTPEVLASYARGFQADARLWTFATAREDVLRKLGDAVGLEFKRVDGRIDHNLRTVVVDAAGRMRRIFRGNEWTPQELAAELRAAARAR